MSDQSTFAPWPEPRRVTVLRRKVEAVEALCIKYRTPPRDGRVPVCQILSAFLDAEESA